MPPRKRAGEAAHHEQDLERIQMKACKDQHYGVRAPVGHRGVITAMLGTEMQ
jgi:hypothetical protein